MVALPVRARSVLCVKPMSAWGPGGPNSAKKDGSLALTHASTTRVPSIVAVCCHDVPPGTMTFTPYLPGARFWMRAQPSSSERT